MPRQFGLYRCSDGTDIAETGTIEGALKFLGFIEFAVDPETPFHNKALEKDAEIILVVLQEEWLL